MNRGQCLLILLTIFLGNNAYCEALADIADGILKEALKNESGYYFASPAEDDSLLENLYGVMSGPNETDVTNQYVFRSGCKRGECDSVKGFYFVDTEKEIYFLGLKPNKSRAGKFIEDDKDRVYHIYYNDKEFLDQYIQQIQDNKGILIDKNKVNYTLLSDRGEQHRIVKTLPVSHDLETEELDYYIKNDKFFTSEGRIPNGCFGQLMTELNGDDSVAAIFVNRTSFRGCINANYTYPGGNDEDVYYTIKQSLGDHAFKIRVCKKVDGSMGQACDRFIIKFVNRKYTFIPNYSKTVLSLEKMGEW